MGVRSLSKGDLKAALTAFEKAAKLNPKGSEIQFNLGLALARLGRPEEAIVHLERSAPEPARSPETKYLIGSCYFQTGEYAKAAAVLGDLGDGPQAEHVLYMLEESNRLLGRADAARENFRQLNRRFPDGAWTHYLMGVAYESSAELDKAIEEYKAAISRDPQLPNAAFAVGYLYWRLRDSTAAAPWFEKQIGTQACHALSMFYLGQIAQTERDEAAAARYYRRSIDCDGNSPEAHLRLGMALAGLNQDQDALRELKRAVELAPQLTNAHYRLARLYQKLGRAEESQAEYAIVKRLNAKDEDPVAKP